MIDRIVVLAALSADVGLLQSVSLYSKIAFWQEIADYNASSPKEKKELRQNGEK